MIPSRITCILLLFSTIYLIACPVSSTSISIKDNAYTNIVVAISPDVPNTWSEVILHNIQLMIRRASSVLYRATKKRSYFKDVRILIPETWSHIRANVSTWETYSTADVRVAPAGSAHGDVPYTVQSGLCGQLGEYIHMTPDYLRTITEPNNTAIFGPAEKVFVHEWAHLRYGVFDEYGQQSSKTFPLFYKLPNSNEIIPNLCTNSPPVFTTKDITTNGPCRIDPSTGVYDKNCIFQLSPEFLPDSSLMSSHAVDSVVDFCQDDQVLRHVYEAPNKHNAMCGSASVWTIISRHPDFASNNNPPKDITYLEPSFQIIRSSGSRFVLVMDTSGSMNDYKRIVRLYESARRWIKYDIVDGSLLGMVQFESKSKILSQMVKIDGDASREALIARLPVSAVGGTCIGCGLQKALEVLRPGGQGGIILLMTDGEETDRPFINEVLQDVIRANVRVVSIAFGRKAEDKIEDLAEKTNGKSYFIDDNDASQGLNDAFIGSQTYQPAVPADQIVVLLFQRQYQNVTGNGLISESFSVDYTVGRNFVFRIDYTTKSYLTSFSLKSPTGTIYTQLEFDDVAKVARLKLPQADVGKWYFTMTVTASRVDALAVHVTSQTRSNTTAPITTECYVPDGSTINNANTSPVRILAKVMQGMNPVVRAKVNAYIQMPSGPTEVIELLDNGAAADTVADDGIYSRYFVAATSQQGRYSVECQVWDDGSAYVNNGFTVHSGVAVELTRSRFPQRRMVTKTIGSFTRMANGGSFKITEASADKDVYPPSRITDLFVVDIETSKNNKSVTIQLTAPGEDLDRGTASSYEIRYSPVFDDVRDDKFGLSGNSTLVVKENIVNGSLQPLESGSKQMISFVLLNNSTGTADVTYFISMKAVDRSDMKSQVSNIVSVQFTSIETTPTGLSKQALIGIIVGSLFGALLIILVIYLIYKKMRYSSYTEAETKPKP